MGPTVATLACAGCGAPLQLRAPGRTVVACAACGAVLDAQSADHRVVARYEARRTVTPGIPLGSRGTLKGDTWEVIGYLVRVTRASGIAYTWFEYLLHGATGDIRWLVHEFRVTVQTAGGTPISKVVVVNTAANAGGWQVTEIEGPLP